MSTTEPKLHALQSRAYCTDPTRPTHCDSSLSGAPICANILLPHTPCNINDTTHVARTRTRTLHDTTPRHTAGALFTFWEADIAGAPLFPEGIKMIVADAVELFGTPLGTQLQDTCMKWGWPLAWSLSTDQGGGALLPPEYLPLRALDVKVMAKTSLNATVTNADQTAWAAAWTRANATRPDWRKLWETIWEVTPPTLQARGVRAYDCADSDCVGVSIVNQKCICPSS